MLMVMMTESILFDSDGYDKDEMIKISRLQQKI